MKKVVDVEKLDLGAVFKKGLSVRDQLVQEWKDTRSRMANVNWQDELESFKKSPLDTAQGYLNQVSEVLKQRRAAEETVVEKQTKVTQSAKKAVTKKKPAAKKKTTRAKSPRTTTAKSTATRRSTPRSKKSTTHTK